MQIIITLALVDILLNLLIYLVFELHQVALVGKQTTDLFKTLERIDFVENLLAFLVFKHDI